MRRRLLLLSALSSALFLAVLAIAIVPLVHSRVTEDLDQHLRRQVLSAAAFILDDAPSDAQMSAYLTQIDNTNGTYLGVKSGSTNAALGKDAAGISQRWPADYRKGGASLPRSIQPLLDPRFYTTETGDHIASLGVFTGTQGWIVEGTVTRHLITTKQVEHWLFNAGFAIAALLISLAGADLLARRITRPITAAVRAAESIGNGNLSAPFPTNGPPEVLNLGRALHHMASRIERLLTGERQRAADLSHRLRTPLTVLALETHRLRPQLADRPEQLRRVTDSIAELENGLDQLIREFQDTRENGVPERSDAAQVLRNHSTYWSAVAQTQGRPVQLDIETDVAPVAIAADQLGVVLDALYSNIFRHTAPGAGYRASIRTTHDIAIIELADDGSTCRATPEPDPPRFGSTGRGLALARSIIEATGGTLNITDNPSTGRTVTITLLKHVEPTALNPR
jgi:signal transduction histidine kinase